MLLDLVTSVEKLETEEISIFEAHQNLELIMVRLRKEFDCDFDFDCYDCEDYIGSSRNADRGKVPRCGISIGIEKTEECRQTIVVDNQ